MFIRISIASPLPKGALARTRPRTALHSPRAAYSTGSNPLGGLGGALPPNVGDLVSNTEYALKDLQVHSQVARLFQSTLGSSGVSLHPDDAELRREAEEAQQRLMARLAEVHKNNPDSFERLVDLINQEAANEAATKEEDKILEGTIPGTRNPPWAGSAVWKAFFEDLKEEAASEHVNMDESDLQRDGLRLDNNETQVMDPFEILAGGDVEDDLITNQMEDTFKLEEFSHKTLKKCKGTCLFCSADREQFPLEPMNVHLLRGFMTSAGFIKSRRQTGLCKKMQGRVSKTIKHARALGLFSYKGGSFRIRNPVICPED